MTFQAPNPGDSSYDPADPHGFHKDAEGHDAHHQHHVSSWKLLVGVLIALLFFTVFTVNVAQGESFLMGRDFPITQLWNVIIAMSIATIKALLVCLYFMHLRHDNPLNSFVLLFTIATLGVFLMFTATDTGSRAMVNPFKAEVLTAGGTGEGMVRKDGRNIAGPIVAQARREAIEDKAAEIAASHGREEPNEDDLYDASEYIWFHLYDAKAEHSHHKPVAWTFDDNPDDDNTRWHDRWMAAGGPERVAHGGAHGGHADDHHGDDHHGDDHADAHHEDDHASDDHGAQHEPMVSTASRSVPRYGLTPGLFDPPHGDHHEDHGGHDDAHDAHGHDEHNADDGHAAPADAHGDDDHGSGGH